MEIYQLKAFIAVAHSGHLTRAAEGLHLSQPAVSKQIRALEETLGVTLFDRLPSGMQLTRAGRELLGAAEATLEQALKLVEQAKSWRGEVSGAVRLGTIIDPEYLRLGPLLGRLLEQYPLIDVKLHHGISGWVSERVACGELDAGFCLGEPQATGLAHVQVATPTYRIVGPTAWRERLERADWEALAAMPWVGTPKRSSQHWLTAQMAQRSGRALNFVVEADQESSMVDLMRTGVGLCLMREELARAAQARGELVVWHGPGQPCPLNFVYPASRSEDRVVAALRQVLAQVWGLADGAGSSSASGAAPPETR